MIIADIVKHVALVVTLLGALFTSLGLDPFNVYLLNFGAVCYLYWSTCVRDWNLVAVNTGLLLIYGTGTLLRVIN